jgi:hypothetical protein
MSFEQVLLVTHAPHRLCHRAIMHHPKDHASARGLTATRNCQRLEMKISLVAKRTSKARLTRRAPMRYACILCSARFDLSILDWIGFAWKVSISAFSFYLFFASNSAATAPIGTG